VNYHLITCIIERGRANKIVDEAIKSGAQAATVFYAHGKGVKERLGLLGRFIQHEKEVILIVTKEDQTQVVFSTVVAAGRLNEPGKGFAFIQPVEQAVGFLA
jgi:nitrogen regulatory protein P-II 1